MRFGTLWTLALLTSAAASAPRAALSQDRPAPVQVASRGPLFLARAPVGVGDRAGQWIDVSNDAVFRRRITVELRNVSREQALAEITRRGGLRLTYSAAVVELDAPVTLVAEDITVGAALSAVLYDAGVDVLLTENARAALVRRSIPLVIQRYGTIVGAVRDSATREGVGGAEVFLAGTPWRTTTDSAGRYRLAEVDTGAYTLTVRKLGYAKEELRVTVRDEQTDTVNVIMKQRAARLTDLVSTATGPRRRVDIANDVTTIDADSVMNAAPIRTLTDLLDTRVPGLTVQRTSGAPGDPARLRLRGASSLLRNNDPIVIVDGVRVYAEQSAGRGANLASSEDSAGASGGRELIRYAAPSPLDYIDPNSIETIEVLKGPSAATLYGQDAANGVIVITTKRGQAGPTRWRASVEHGRTAMLGEYPELFFRWGRDIYDGDPINCPVTGYSGLVPCEGDSVLTFQLLNDPALTVLDHGGHARFSLTASGGTPALTYAVTGSYQDVDGLIRLPGYEMDRYQARFGAVPPDWMQRPQHLKQWGATSKISARLGAKADVTMTAAITSTDQQKSSLQNQLGTLMSTFLDRSSGLYYTAGGPTPRFGAATTNDVLSDYYERVTAAAAAFTNNVSLNYRPVSWLTMVATAGINVTQRTDQLYFPRGPNLGTDVDPDTAGYVNDAQGHSVVSTVNLRANARRNVGRGFQLQFAMGMNYTGQTTNDVANGTKNLPPGTSLQGDSTVFVRRAETSDATFGWYMEPSIGNSKFNFSSGLRLDGGKNYGGNVSGLKLPKFPRLGFSYLISDEPFFPLKDVFQSLRLRIAYGAASRQPGITDRLRLYSAPGEVFDGDFQTGVALETLGNTEVRPERSSELEGGFDADLLDSRLSFDVTGYRKTTHDALLFVPVAPSVYGSNVRIIKNIGVTRNTGLDLNIGAQVLRGGPIAWHTGLRLSWRRDLVVELGPDVEPFYSNGDELAGGLRVAPGYPVFGRWTRPILGYADADGNGVLERAEFQLGDTAVYVGATLPNYTANIVTTASFWHGAVSLNANFTYEDGLSQRNTVAQQLGIFSRGAQVPGTSLAEQAGTIVLTKNEDDGLGSRVDVSDYNWIQTVNTMRFNSLGITLRIPTGIVRRIGAQQMSVSVQGSNLALWTNYRGLDPNVNAFATGNHVTDTGILPQPRTWQVRINASY